MLSPGNCKQIDYGAISLKKQLDSPRIKEEHHNCEIPPPIPPILASFKEAVIRYITEFVILKLQEPPCFISCKSTLTDSSKVNHSSLTLIKRKDLGRLIYPSHNAILVCQETEKLIHDSIDSQGFVNFFENSDDAEGVRIENVHAFEDKMV
ncbi:uncharacterized protein [Lepeophtheirus salmonis]|uniref:uncharacterized protein n=1 Tax=Lepeophtheirus salmonis TaxID=72036 RepID=UPI003AF3B6EB